MTDNRTDQEVIIQQLDAIIELLTEIRDMERQPLYTLKWNDENNEGCSSCNPEIVIRRQCDEDGND